MNNLRRQWLPKIAKFVAQTMNNSRMTNRNGRNSFDQRRSGVAEYIRKSWLIILFGVVLTFAGVFVLLKNEVKNSQGNRFEFWNEFLNKIFPQNFPCRNKRHGKSSHWMKQWAVWWLWNPMRINRTSKTDKSFTSLANCTRMNRSQSPTTIFRCKRWNWSDESKCTNGWSRQRKSNVIVIKGTTDWTIFAENQIMAKVRISSTPKWPHTIMWQIGRIIWLIHRYFTFDTVTKIPKFFQSKIAFKLRPMWTLAILNWAWRPNRKSQILLTSRQTHDPTIHR